MADNNKTFWGNFKDNVWTNNPIFVQILGICSTLAVTNNMINTLIMCVAIIFATSFSSYTISLIKDFIPRKVRMIVQVIVISFYVIIVDIILRAYQPDVSKTLGPYVGLIITNCILMGRAEAFAQVNKPLISFWDGVTSGLGYTFVLMAIAVFRELLGFGTLFGISVLQTIDNGGWFTPWIIMITPPSAFFFLAGIMWIVKNIMNRKPAKAPVAAPAAQGAKA